jgi:hypothetical protein
VLNYYFEVLGMTFGGSSNRIGVFTFALEAGE